jgi:hypothetical protein
MTPLLFSLKARKSCSLLFGKRKRSDFFSGGGSVFCPIDFLSGGSLAIDDFDDSASTLSQKLAFLRS